MTSVAGGDAVVQSAGGAAPVQLRHAGGPVERRLHLCRDVQEEVSEKCDCLAPVKGFSSSPINMLCADVFASGRWNAEVSADMFTRCSFISLHLTLNGLLWPSVTMETLRSS